MRKIHRQDGSTVEFSYVPLPDGSNFMSYYDVTNHILLEKAFEERKAAQQNADRLKSDFISNMSYEMRTPLNVLIGYSELLAKESAGDLNTQQKSYCTDILTSSKRLLSLVNNILDLAMIESGHIQLKREICDFWEIFQETLESYNAQCDQNSNLLQVKVPLEKAFITGDPKHLKHALETLLIHATSTIENHHDIGLKMMQNSEKISIDITLPCSHHKNQSGLIYHLAPGKTLGISLAQHIFEAHGGHFQQKTSSANTITMHLEFPLNESAESIALPTRFRMI